jgi:glycosyltransferase involved in cell wall biosynthesis
MKKLYYLTRSYLPGKTGGIFMRAGAVNLLRQNGFDVTVITPNYETGYIVKKDHIIYLPLTYSLRIANALERIGIIEDYLDKWVKQVVNYLQTEITSEDILFATCGGEIGNIKIGSILKEKKGCKFVVNFRDPIDYSLVNGLKLDSSFHVSREKQEEKYLRNADLVITSSETMQKSLQSKYSWLSLCAVNNYFGYIDQAELVDKVSSTKLRIAYGGAFTPLQAPEILAKILQDVDDIEAYFIGDYEKYAPIKPYLGNYKFIKFMPRKEFLKLMLNHIDVGFVSLHNDYLGACVPSKIYEYINLGIPILGVLPEGSAKDLINKYEYGIACNYKDVKMIRNAVFTIKNNSEKYRMNILRDRESWSMEQRIQEVVKWLQNL